jgi:hypothetical protein
MSEEANEFSVCQFFPDGSYEYVRRFVSAKEAIAVAQAFTSNPRAKAGLIQRVIITDGDDCIVVQWQHGKGITFPPPIINN